MLHRLDQILLSTFKKKKSQATARHAVHDAEQLIKLEPASVLIC